MSAAVEKKRKEQIEKQIIKHFPLWPQKTFWE